MATIIDKYRLTPTLHLGVRWRKAGKEGVRNLRKIDRYKSKKLTYTE